VENIKGIVVIVGNYGSGKTEVSINLAVNRKRSGLDVRIADLDLVNPYFRTREARKPLSELGIDVIVPPEELLQADLPVLVPAVAGMIRQPTQLTVLDAGGDGVGATVLATLADAFRNMPVQVLQVVNPFRPFTDTIAGCHEIRKRIERASKMSVTGIIGNANLIDETTVEDVYRGYDFVRVFSKESGLPLEMITIAAALRPEIECSRFSCPILTIERQLVPPWKKPAKLVSQ
jgi:hypothetical protein